MAQRPAPSRWLTLDDGARLAVWTTGSPGEHPPVVLVHGGPGMWDYLAPAAAMIDDLTVVHRYDQRACGLSVGVSADEGDPGDFDTAVADLAALIGQVLDDDPTHQQVVLIGHSFGATLALAVAAEHHDLVCAVGYISGVGVGDWRTPFRARRAEQLGPDAARLGELERAREHPEQNPEFRRLQWMHDYADPERGAVLAEALDGAINWRANRGIRFTDQQQRHWAARVQCPVTVVHGALDARPMATAVALADLIAVRRKRVLPDAAHMVFDDDPYGSSELLREIVLTSS